MQHLPTESAHHSQSKLEENKSKALKIKYRTFVFIGIRKKRPEKKQEMIDKNDLTHLKCELRALPIECYRTTFGMFRVL